MNASKKEEYKDLYKNDVHEHINRRFKDEKKLQEQLDSYTPLMSVLGMRYGLQEPTVPNVMEAIDQDNSFWEEQALKENMTVDQLKHMRKLEADNQQLIDTGHPSTANPAEGRYICEMGQGS